MLETGASCMQAGMLPSMHPQIAEGIMSTTKSAHAHAHVQILVSCKHAGIDSYNAYTYCIMHACVSIYTYT